MSGRLDGKVVVVTGAGRGIGRAHAEFLAAEGALVVVNDTGGDISGLGEDTGAAAEVVRAIRASGGTAVVDTSDVSSDGDRIVANALSAFGRLDGLVNNAGIVSTAGVEELTDAQVHRMIGVHVLGTLGTVRAAWPVMREQGRGRIVNTSSVAVFGVGGGPLYPMAKGAIHALTRALALDGAPLGITVNAVMPMGYSRMADTQEGLGDFMKANFDPRRISPFVGSLLVDEVPCTGETFAVAGGRAARVFLGTVPGLVGFSSIDDCLAGFDQVMDLEGYAAPASMDEEIGFEYAQLGIDLAALGIDLSRLGTAGS